MSRTYSEPLTPQIVTTCTAFLVVLRKNSRGDAFQAVMVVYTVEPSTGNDAIRR